MRHDSTVARTGRRRSGHRRHPDRSARGQLVVQDMRLSRTLAGVALGLAGAAIQG
ncbi:hypothetical protein ACIQOU_03405 [Streptomyces sp. NPDC091279]|uniref:hypothetical protein n=1 Tax=Streptomyces sp. NPDC091279 TaxID=3365983 RepID=UPI00381B1296